MAKTTEEQSKGALLEAKKLLDELEIPFCLFLGTSLGAYRDGTFCPGDIDDMDLAIDIKYFPRLQEIKDKFKDWDNENNWCADDGLCPESAFVKRWNGCYSKVDLFFISEVDGQHAWRFYPGHNANDGVTKLMDKKFLDNQEKLMFFGEEFNIPGHTEEYFELNYGKDWRTPLHRKFFTWRENNFAPVV